MDLREIQDTYTGSEELRKLNEQMNADAEAIAQLISTNARVAQNQDVLDHPDPVCGDCNELNGIGTDCEREVKE